LSGLAVGNDKLIVGCNLTLISRDWTELRCNASERERGAEICQSILSATK